VGVDCKKYEEPGPCGSAGIFLLGEQTEGDTSGREEVEAGSLSLEINDSNKCHCLLPSIASPPAVSNHHQADDINASPPAGNRHASPPAGNHQDFEATTAPVDGDQVKEELSIAPPKPSKPIPSRPKTSNKFGRGKRRGGDRKTTLTIDTILPAPQAADMGGVAGNRSPAIAKKSTKKQLIRSLNKSEKKRQMTEDKMVVVTKKLHTTANDCKTLAVLAQERRRERNLALQHADCLITGMRDKMTTRLRLAVRDVADAQETAARDVADAQETAARDVADAQESAARGVAYAQETSAKAIMEEQQYHYGKACATCKKHAKQISLDRRNFAVVVKNLKRTSTCNSKKSAIVIRKQASMIKRLETKVSSAELSVEFMQNQLQNEHKEAIADLVIGHRGSIRDLKYCHATNLAEEKKKLRQQLCIKHQRHNSLYNEGLDYRHKRVATKAGNMSRSLSSKRLNQLKAWRSKCLEEIVKDKLVDQQRSIMSWNSDSKSIVKLLETKQN